MRNLFSMLFFIFSYSLVSSSQSIDNDNFVVTHGPYLQNLSDEGMTIINKSAIK